MDFLKAEIEKRKRNATATEIVEASNNNSAQPKKYVKRGEFEKERERKYKEEQDEVNIL
jgi:hypothetical protein